MDASRAQLLSDVSRPRSLQRRDPDGVTTFPISGAVADDHLEHLTAVIKQRDIASFIALFSYFAPRIKAFMRKLGASDEAAEEMAQDAMFIVWRKAATYNPTKSAVSSWVYTIARNLRIDALRREQRRNLDPNDPLLMPLPQAAPDLLLEAHQEQRRMRKALGALPRDQAAVVSLAFYEGKSHAEIATALAIPLGTVKSRMRLAFQRMRVLLEESAPPPLVIPVKPAAAVRAA